jgi:hypothetical protein
MQNVAKLVQKCSVKHGGKPPVIAVAGKFLNNVFLPIMFID